jgi:hypothetical protein
MAFNIEQFKSKGLTLGGARSSLFTCEIVFPPGANIQTGVNSKFTFSCRAAELPAMTIGTVEVPYFGRRIKIAGDRTFADWTATIMNDEDWAVRSAFEAWQNAINEMVGNVRVGQFVNELPTSQGPIGILAGQNITGASYKQTVTITQFGKGGNEVAKYQLIGAYPTDLGAITLDWDNQNQIETFPVTIAYDYWVPVTTINGVVNPSGSVLATDYSSQLS